jgi:tetratricopeptide (TPR) repeat protein
MKRVLLVFFAAFLMISFITSPAWTDEESTASPHTPYHPGPRSPLEEKTLTAEGLQAFEVNDYPAAILSLERLLARYPSTTNAANLHRLLGLAFFHQKAFPRAVPELRIYILHAISPSKHAKNSTLDPTLADCYLKIAQAYLELNQTSLANTAVSELLKLKPGLDIRDQALILKTRILLASGDLKRSQRTYDAITNKAETHTLAFDLKIGHCKAHSLANITLKPGSNAKAEAQDQVDLARMATCYQEALAKKADARWCDAIKNHEISLLEMRSAKQGFSESHRTYIRDTFTKMKKNETAASLCP